MTIQQLLHISRPRFWLYVAGTYIVGYALGVSTYSQFLYPLFWVQLLFFLFPANFWIYGVNDYHDFDTDHFNPKKGSYEIKIEEKEKAAIRYWLKNVFWLTVILLLVQSIGASLWLLLFMTLGWTYSSPPMRFKARPFMDSLSNILYAIPGFLGYWQAGFMFPSWYSVIAAWCWVAAMHWYSAIPDIEADTNAGLKTGATILGREKSLVGCALLWLGSVILGGFAGLGWWAVIGLIYVGIALWLITKPQEKVMLVYRYFPYLNGALGMGLWWWAVLA